MNTGGQLRDLPIIAINMQRTLKYKSSAQSRKCMWIPSRTIAQICPNLLLLSSFIEFNASSATELPILETWSCSTILHFLSLLTYGSSVSQEEAMARIFLNFSNSPNRHYSLLIIFHLDPLNEPSKTLPWVLLIPIHHFHNLVMCLSYFFSRVFLSFFLSLFLAQKTLIY